MLFPFLYTVRHALRSRNFRLMCKSALPGSKVPLSGPCTASARTAVHRRPLRTEQWKAKPPRRFLPSDHISGQASAILPARPRKAPFFPREHPIGSGLSACFRKEPPLLRRSAADPSPLWEAMPSPRFPAVRCPRSEHQAAKLQESPGKLHLYPAEGHFLRMRHPASSRIRKLPKNVSALCGYPGHRKFPPMRGPQSDQPPRTESSRSRTAFISVSISGFLLGSRRSREG